MGYVMMYGECYSCGKVFGFNPHRVPSIRIDGKRQPLCRACVEKANPLREANGLPPAVIYDDAYDALPEDEL